MNAEPIQANRNAAWYWRSALWVFLCVVLMLAAPARGSSDDDGDGIPNADDQCLLTPATEVNDVNDVGCGPSERDSDSDGVVDSSDECPSTTLGRSVLLNGCAFIPATLTQQIGADIIGENPEDKFGIEVALSADGNTLAVGARDNDGGGTNSGHVRAYRRVSNAWLQLGSDIDGEAADDRSGNAIALSADGNIMAIGADENDGGGTNTGSVRIYQFIGGDWSQLGSDLDGEFAYDYFGYSVSLSSDGATLAVGSVLGESSRGYTGHTRVYRWTDGAWLQLGGDIAGERSYDYSGSSVSLSSDGKTVAIGARQFDGASLGQDDNRGRVRVFRWTEGAWLQVGADIEGQTAGELSGYSVSLSSSGDTVAIGVPLKKLAGLYAGEVRVFRLTEDVQWSQMGSSLSGAVVAGESGEQLGYDVSLSGDGLTLAAGAPVRDRARVYRWDNSAWVLSDELIGDARSQAGIGLALSTDAQTAAVGAPYLYDILNPGSVRVYRLGQPDQQDSDEDDVADVLDAFPLDPSETTDSDGDGVGDNADVFPDDPTEAFDTDGDGIGNNADLNDDGDAFLDVDDQCPLTPLALINAIDEFGCHESELDTDGDSITNDIDTDDDGDGVEDNLDAFPLDASETVDTDADGIGNNADTDDDGDGVPDVDDQCPLTSADRIDEIDDTGCSPNERDTDRDGITDDIDTDDDGDGVEDEFDAFPLDPSETVDTDGDGVGDNSDVFPNDPNETVDTDGDGVGDNGDVFPLDVTEWLDSDGDGVGDNSDVFPLDPNETLDTDGDGVGDNGDAFPLDPTETLDTDSDGVGDNSDAFPTDPAETNDLDGDGIGDNADTDDDGDGVEDGADECPTTTLGRPVLDNGCSFLAPFEQVGADLTGASAGDHFGHAVANSADGLTIAIGAPYTGTNGSETGLVRVYRWLDNQWSQLGEDFTGAAAGNHLGYAVALTDDGQTLVVGAPQNDEAYNNSGQAKVYRWTGNAWTQLGSDLNGKEPGAKFGYSASISADGRTLAVGAPYDGEVSVYRLVDDEWLDSGMSHLFSEIAALYGYSVSLSADGDTLAVGSPSWDDPDRGNCLNDGRVWIYRFLENGWRDFGIPIGGLYSESGIGWSVSLSSDGNTVAVGAPYEGRSCEGFSNRPPLRGSVEVYEWTGTQLNDDYLQSTYWTLRQQFNGTVAGERAGFSVSLAGAAQRLLIGTGARGTVAPGYARPYELIDGLFTQPVPDISGGGGDVSVSLSRNGERFLVGAPANSDNGDEAGKVIVYRLGEREQDSDEDGVADVDDAFPLDASESVDTDGDGAGDNADPDDDGDGVDDLLDAFPLDASETVDSDFDGIGNNADNDDDGDGYIDINDECPLTPISEVDTVNEVGCSIGEIDTDGDGLINSVDNDDDGDDVPDAEDAFPLDSSESLDTDGDGIGNNADSDDDDDGVEDSLDDFPLDPSETVDTDGDGIGNNADTDDDGDGVADVSDAYPLDPAENIDSDDDGIGNNADTDDDGDGTPDIIDVFPLDPTESIDTDSDGIGNNADTDDDGDGALDVEDAFPLDETETLDTDGDGVGNNADTDDDGDGVLDVSDQCPLTPAEDISNINEVGCSIGEIDTDGDGLINSLDDDDDGDGIADTEDAFPLDETETLDTDGDGIGNNTDTDDDGDGVADSEDAFPLDETETLDTDRDGVGNNVDTDDDGDGVPDTEDDLPLDSSEAVDTDGDGIGNNIDTDDDGDGAPDSEDAFPLDATETLDTDSDGIGNNADTDDDGDGITDSEDAFPLDATETLDADGDGVGDNSDAFPNDPAESLDTDGDGLGDNLETSLGTNVSATDSDADGYSDYEEWIEQTDPLDPSDVPVVGGLPIWLIIDVIRTRI